MIFALNTGSNVPLFKKKSRRGFWIKCNKYTVESLFWA